MAEYTSARLNDGYCSTNPSGVTPSWKAATTVSRVTRVEPTRSTASASAVTGLRSGVDIDNLLLNRYVPIPSHSTLDFRRFATASIDRRRFLLAARPSLAYLPASRTLSTEVRMRTIVVSLLLLLPSLVPAIDVSPPTGDTIVPEGAKLELLFT